MDCTVDPEYAPRPFVDFQLGDTIGLDINRFNLSLSTAQRVNSIQFQLDENLLETSIQLGFEVI